MSKQKQPELHTTHQIFPPYLAGATILFFFRRTSLEDCDLKVTKTFRDLDPRSIVDDINGVNTVI